MEDLTIFILILINGRLATLAAESLSELLFGVIDQLRIDFVVHIIQIALSVVHMHM